MTLYRRLTTAAAALGTLCVSGAALAHPGHTHGAEGALHHVPEYAAVAAIVAVVGGVTYHLRARNSR